MENITPPALDSQQMPKQYPAGNPAKQQARVPEQYPVGNPAEEQRMPEQYPAAKPGEPSGPQRALVRTYAQYLDSVGKPDEPSGPQTTLVRTYAEYLDSVGKPGEPSAPQTTNSYRYMHLRHLLYQCHEYGIDLFSVDEQYTILGRWTTDPRSLGLLASACKFTVFSIPAFKFSFISQTQLERLDARSGLEILYSGTVARSRLSDPETWSVWIGRTVVSRTVRTHVWYRNDSQLNGIFIVTGIWPGLYEAFFKLTDLLLMVQQAVARHALTKNKQHQHCPDGPDRRGRLFRVTTVTEDFMRCSCTTISLFMEGEPVTWTAGTSLFVMFCVGLASVNRDILRGGGRGSHEPWAMGHECI
ncbi:hypothetical protein DEU56DRAFT_961176 [Suillus clintonianus]|uniref:uncharacterized protein n=1 Tax=Suillus clintonianus TaxID=1904413 RepID=UPI001B865F0C|nr:uncharacterized protein DEU56DRAFT_961176 [Suillus clintonianus]KAG2125719.1 hypothetical protein DEU56DRAFT_961176 [Suillus clintonianus]